MNEVLGPYVPVCSLGTSYDVPFSPDGATLALVRGSKVVLWGVEQCAPVGELRFRYGAGADFSPDGRLLAVLSTSGAVAVHRVSDLELTCSPDRTTFAYTSHADENDVVRLRRWPFGDGPAEDAARPAGSRVMIDALALSSDGLLAVRTYDRLAVWRVGADRPIAQREMEPSGTGEGLTWLPDGKLVATDADPDRAKRVLLLGADLELEHAVGLPYACSVSLSPDGDLAIGSWQSGVLMRRASR